MSECQKMKKRRNVHVEYERDCRLAVYLITFVLSQCFCVRNLSRTKYKSGNFTRLRSNNHTTGSDILKSPGNFSYTCAHSRGCIFAHKSLNSSRKTYKYINMKNSCLFFTFVLKRIVNLQTRALKPTTIISL